MYLIGRDYRAGKAALDARPLAAELDVPGHRARAACSPPGGSGPDRGDREGAIRAGPRSGGHRSWRSSMRSARRKRRSAPSIRAVAPAVQVLARIEGALERELGERSLKDFIADEQASRLPGT